MRFWYIFKQIIFLFLFLTQIINSGTLSITGTAAEDTGTYTVKISNGFSEDTASATLTIAVGSCDFEENLCGLTLSYKPSFYFLRTKDSGLSDHTINGKG